MYYIVLFVQTAFSPLALMLAHAFDTVSLVSLWQAQGELGLAQPCQDDF